jgi:tetratricopeptide (TPR) repeat protein
LGRLYQRLGNLEVAIPALEKAVQADPAVLASTPVSWWLDLADAYAAAGPTYADKAVGAYTTAADVATPVLRLEGAGRIATLRGETLGLKARARALAGRGAVHAAADRRTQALRDCVEAIRIEPNYAYPRVTLAQLFAASGEYDRALREWTIISQLAPRASSFINSDRGAIWRDRCRVTSDAGTRKAYLQNAVISYRAALLDPPDASTEADIRTGLAEVLTELGLIREAVAERERVVAIGDELADADTYRLELAIAYEGAKRFSEAEEQFLKCLQHRQRVFRESHVGGPDWKEARKSLTIVENYLAYLYAQQGVELEEGRRLVEEALALVPASDDPLLHSAYLDTRGWLRYQQDDFAGAIEDFSNAISLERGQDATLERKHLALTYEARAARSTRRTEQRADLELANQQWQYIVDLDPDSPIAETARNHLETAAL